MSYAHTAMRIKMLTESLKVLWSLFTKRSRSEVFRYE